MPNWAKIIKFIAAGTEQAGKMAVNKSVESSAARELVGKEVLGRKIVDVTKNATNKNTRFIFFSDGSGTELSTKLTSDLAADLGGARSIRSKIPRGAKEPPMEESLAHFSRNYKKAKFNDSRSISAMQKELDFQREYAKQMGFESVPYKILMAPDGIPVTVAEPHVKNVLRSGQATRLRKGQRRGQK